MNNFSTKVLISISHQLKIIFKIVNYQRNYNLIKVKITQEERKKHINFINAKRKKEQKTNIKSCNLLTSKPHVDYIIAQN